MTPALTNRERLHDLLERLGPVSGRLALLSFLIGITTLAVLMLIMLST